jgi:hypothetical protein
MSDKRKTYSIVPAAPGWYVLDPIAGCGPDGDDYEFIKEPIIAWHILQEFSPSETDLERVLSAPSPITCRQHPMANDSLADVIIQRPDGTCYNHDSHFEDARGAIEYWKAQDAIQKAARTASRVTRNRGAKRRARR